MGNKKIIAFILTAALLAPLSGCAKNEDLPASTGTAAETGIVTETAPAADAAGFDFSAGIGSNGYFEGFRALDHVKLPEYKGISIPAENHTATDEEIGSQVNSLLASYKENVKITDRAVESGDTVNIDYVGSVDGVEFAGGNTQGNGTDVTAGGANYIDDFLTQIIGHTPGETFDVNVTFPDPYENDPDLAGKEAVFVTTINYISEENVPELTDEFVQTKLAENYPWQSAAEVTDYIRSMIEESKINSFIDNYLIDNSEITEIPEILVDYQLGAYKSYYTNYAAQYGMTLSDYITANGYDSEDAYFEAQRPVYEKAAKVMLLVQAVAESEEIEVSEDEVDAFIKSQYLSVPDDTIPEIKEYYGVEFWMRELIADGVYGMITADAKLK